MILAEVITADIWAIALSIIGFLLSLQGLWLLCRALWPKRVEAAAFRCGRNGLACFFLGLVVTAVTFLIIATASQTLGAPGQMGAFAVGFVYLIFAGMGGSGFVTHIGRRLASPSDAERPWRATVRGGVALELACLIPVLGWLGILPLSFVIGAGAATLSLFTRMQSPSSTQPQNHHEELFTSRGSARTPIELPALEMQEALR